MMSMNPTASNIEKIEFPKEIRDVSTLLELIQNKDKVAAFLKAIDEHASKANALIEKVGKAQEIGKLWEAARAKEQKATELLSDAENRASNILRDSEEKSALLMANAESNADKLLSEAEAARAAAIQDATQAKEDKTSSEKASKELEAQIKVMESKQARLDKGLAEIERKKALLAQI